MEASGEFDMPPGFELKWKAGANPGTVDFSGEVLTSKNESHKFKVTVRKEDAERLNDYVAAATSEHYRLMAIIGDDIKPGMGGDGGQKHIWGAEAGDEGEARVKIVALAMLMIKKVSGAADPKAPFAHGNNGEPKDKSLFGQAKFCAMLPPDFLAAFGYKAILATCQRILDGNYGVPDLAGIKTRLNF